MSRHVSPGLGPRHDAASRIQKPESAAGRLAALKARVAAAIGTTTQAKGAPSGLTGLAPTNQATGLRTALHPVLADAGQFKLPAKALKPGHRDSSKAPPSKKIDFEPKSNPYIDNTNNATRQPRKLQFNQKGKYIALGSALRKQKALEDLKKRIAAQTRKSGINDDLDVQRCYLIEEPPAINWWDSGLVDGDSYDNVEDPKVLKIDTPDSIITALRQHPIPIEPPQESIAPPPKPLYLTRKETQKLRRQRRGAELKEHQALVRLGLEKPDEPKVKLGNLMRVLGDAAINDPTAIESQVKKQIKDRHDRHIQTNEERKLTKEQKHEKLAVNQVKDAEKGLHILVFKIDSLANGQHRYKLNVNAEQMALTGVCLMNPRFSLVVVEGGSYSIRKYKSLMCSRINWSDNQPSKDKERSDTLRQWLMAEDEKGELKNMASNKCVLVFEGDVKARAFSRWGSKVCETDAEAREVLARAKMENFWNLAKSTP